MRVFSIKAFDGGVGQGSGIYNNLLRLQICLQNWRLLVKLWYKIILSPMNDWMYLWQIADYRCFILLRAF